MESKNTLKVKKMVLTAIFAALSIVIGMFEIPWPPMPFLKIDFSEVVILISLLFIGYPRTIIVIILRSLVREFTGAKPFEMGIPLIGEIMAILGSLVLITVYKLLFMRKKVTETNLFILKEKPSPLIVIIKNVIVVLVFAIFMTSLNYFFVWPMFLSGFSHFHFLSFVRDLNPDIVKYTNGSLWGYTITILTASLPFNLVKGVLNLIVFDLIKVGLSKTRYYETQIKEPVEAIERTDREKRI